MQLQGDLSNFPLWELLELCIDTMISGAIEVTLPRGVYSLYLEEGKLYHAHAPSTTGFAALWPLFEVDAAPYLFVLGGRIGARTITDDTRAVMKRALELALRWRRMQPYIMGPSDVPHFIAPSTTDHVQINEEDWPVLGCIDDQHTIADIARLTVIDELTVCKSLLRLRRRGLVLLDTTPPAPKPVDVPLPAPNPPPTETYAPVTSFFAKTLAALPLDQFNAPTQAPPSAPPSIKRTINWEDDVIVRILRTP